MSKKRLIDEIILDHGVTPEAAEAMVNKVFASLADALRNGKVIIPGFGIFDRRIRKGRIARNVSTGEPMTTQDKEVIRFRDRSN